MTRPYAERLLEWWDRHGRQDLPWQHPRTPYRVWISEVMLQQTQVSTVIGYFERWMQRFPDLDTLAKADEDAVLAAWSGLGYYARARNLHKAARLCCSQYDSRLPLDEESLHALPGIGRSTANAIISQSADKPAAVLDGNVKRTLARHALIEDWTGGSKAVKALWREAELRLPSSRGADYTQAAMDLGALICVRQNPLCNECPVSQDCKALIAGRVDEIPLRRPRRKLRQTNLAMLIVRDRKGNVLLEKRPPSGIWGGLWAFPCGPNIKAVTDILGMRTSNISPMIPRVHRLTHLEMQIEPYQGGNIVPAEVKCSPGQRWASLTEAAGMGMPKPVLDLLREIEIGEAE